MTPCPCRLVLYSDLTMCAACGLQWDTNDSDPPQCRLSPPTKSYFDQVLAGLAWVVTVAVTIVSAVQWVIFGDVFSIGAFLVLLWLTLRGP